MAHLFPQLRLPDLAQSPFATGKTNPPAHRDGHLKGLAFKEKFDGPNAPERSTIFQAAV
jgi:hypothetical protein